MKKTSVKCQVTWRQAVAVLFLAMALGTAIPVRAATVQYSYDALNRLTQVTYIDNTTIIYNYDSVGNWTTNSVTVMADTDTDGIPDWWMTLYFGHPTGQAGDASRVGDDADGDGMTNLQEFQAGTDPRDSRNALRILLVERSGTDFTFTMPTVYRKSYMIEYKNDISDPSWSPLMDEFVGTGGLVQIVDPGVTDLPRRFYRIHLLQ